MLALKKGKKKSCNYIPEAETFSKPYKLSSWGKDLYFFMIQQHLTDHIQRQNSLSYLNTFHICFLSCWFFSFSLPAGCFINNYMYYQKWLSREEVNMTEVHFPARYCKNFRIYFARETHILNEEITCPEFNSAHLNKIPIPCSSFLEYHFPAWQCFYIKKLIPAHLCSWIAALTTHY